MKKIETRGAASCLACGSSSTIRAHLIPQAFAREIRDGAPNFALTNWTSLKFQLIQNGLFDDAILCRECDNHLGQHEKYAFETFGLLRRATVEKINTHVGVSHVSGDRLIRFAAGISWKYSVTEPAYGRIRIGPYAKTLKQVAFGGEAIPQSMNMFMVRLKGLRYEHHFFRTPKPDRQFGLNFVRLTLGAFVMFLKIDQRPSPHMPVPEVWMRGRTEVVFPVLPILMFEEGRSLIDAMSNEKLARFFVGDVLREIERPNLKNSFLAQ